MFLMAAVGEAKAAEPAGETVDRAISSYVLPSYADFAEASDTAAQSVTALCAAPSAATLKVARDASRRAFSSFSGVEMFRFGPARTDEKFERVFFWPDRRGRGLRQVQTVLAEQDPTARSAKTLAGKSVAVQGLQALEFVLFGTGSDELATAPSGYRCAYAAAIARNVANVANAMETAWRTAYAATMRTPAPDNAEYRTHGEALQALLQAAKEQLQAVAGFKIERPLGRADAPPKPRTAPFWRSGASFETTLANIDGVRAMILAMDLAKAMPKDRQSLPEELDFNLRAARSALVDVASKADGWPDALAQEELVGLLAYARLSVGYAVELLGGRVPAALGLISGFNQLDGD